MFADMQCCLGGLSSSLGLLVHACVHATCPCRYMVLCGHDGEKDHALKLIRAAHDMIEVTRQPLSSGEIINLRIGINTGAAHSGVLGTKRFKYTVWGDR